MSKLVPCKECGHQISKRAKTCPGCGAKPKRTSPVAVLLAILLIPGMIISMTSGNSNAPSTSRANASAAAGGAKLEVESWNCGHEHGYSKVTGRVKNISDQPLENVTAVGEFFTSDNTFVKSSEALIDYNPILAGQSSPFEVLTTHNPAISTCNISFKKLMGGTIETKEK